jgi:hypothetical protein
MAAVLNRTTKQLLSSVNTPDYSTTDWIINPNLSGVMGVPVEYWKITGDVVSEMDQAEKDAVDAILIVGEKDTKIDAFYYEATRIVEDRYAASVMSGFCALLSDAIGAGLMNRAAYIYTLLNWGLVVRQAWENKAAEINSKTTRTDVAAVTWDTSALIAADPHVTLGGALAINN